MKKIETQVFWSEAKLDLHAPIQDQTKSEEWFKRSKKRIPGCAQTFSKSHSQFVQGVSPIFLQKGAGAHVWDVDGNMYIDYVQGLLPNILGYAHPKVNQAVIEQIQEGYSFSQPHPKEVLLSEKLCEIIPCAEMVRFGKNGSDATAAAVRCARAFTKKDRVACCGYHGWQDWFIGSTNRNEGVPQAVRNLTHPFQYNNIDSLEKLLNQYRGEFSAIIMEPVNFEEPKEQFLEKVRELATQNSIVLIYDEICTGFRFGLGGAQKRYNVIPDLAAFGKAMGNGYPISAVCGKAEIMKKFEDIFFSGTFGGDVASITACLKVIEILETTDALESIQYWGKGLKEGFQSLVKMAGLENFLSICGDPAWSLIKYTDRQGKSSMLTRTLFQQEAVIRGLLITVSHNMTSTHRETEITTTLQKYAEIFKVLGHYVNDSNPEKYLKGNVIEPIFRIR